VGILFCFKFCSQSCFKVLNPLDARTSGRGFDVRDQFLGVPAPACTCDDVVLQVWWPVLPSRRAWR
jgi:hypothetical protein